MKGNTNLSLKTPLNDLTKIVLIGVLILAFSLNIGDLLFKIDTIKYENNSIMFADPNLDLNPNQNLIINKKNPLLLSSGLVKAEEAELRVILWFDSGKPQENLMESLPQDNWVWQESNPTSSRIAGYSLAGFTRITQKSEQAIYSWYQGLAQAVGRAGGIAYLDERVLEGVDIVQYALQQNILPRQFALTEGVLSVAGWQESPLPEVVAGSDIVNIQLISQGYGKGKTALALPVLLEEF